MSCPGFPTPRDRVDFAAAQSSSARSTDSLNRRVNCPHLAKRACRLMDQGRTKASDFETLRIWSEPERPVELNRCAVDEMTPPGASVLSVRRPASGVLGSGRANRGDFSGKQSPLALTPAAPSSAHVDVTPVN